MDQRNKLNTTNVLHNRWIEKRLTKTLAKHELTDSISAFVYRSVDVKPYFTETQFEIWLM